jgi:hypothetical protein
MLRSSIIGNILTDKPTFNREARFRNRESGISQTAADFGTGIRHNQRHGFALLSQQAQIEAVISEVAQTHCGVTNLKEHPR